jgi:hypothetical protein
VLCFSFTDLGKRELRKREKEKKKKKKKKKSQGYLTLLLVVPRW